MMPTSFWYEQLDECLVEKTPVRMIDRCEIDGTQATGVKAVSMDELFFQGHFPAQPVMPGVLQVAAMHQLSSAVLNADQEKPVTWRIASLEKVKFRSPVVPGDFLTITTIQQEVSEAETFKFKAETRVGDKVAAQAVMTLVKAEKLTVPASRNLIAGKPVLPEDLTDVTSESMVIEEIMKAIPHRFPFLLVDRVLHADGPGSRVTGLKNVTGGEWCFTGTALASVPEYLLVEMAAQTGCALALTKPENEGKIVFFMSIDDAKYHAPVVPGDQLVIDIEVRDKGRFGRAEGTIKIEKELVCEFAFKFAVMDEE
jgi:3-hydroxyacyl-[acyl-carrier-protein] dehydratase